MKKTSGNSIDKYISSFPPNARKMMVKLKATIKTLAPKAQETITWRMPTFKLNGNLVHFAGYKHHIGLYPGAEAIVAFKKYLSPYKHSKGAIRFPLDKPIPYGLVKKIVKFRVKASLETARERS